MQAKIFGTADTADAAPIPADNPNAQDVDVTMLLVFEIRNALLCKVLSAGIGAASAVIGGPRLSSRGAR